MPVIVIVIVTVPVAITFIAPVSITVTVTVIHVTDIIMLPLVELPVQAQQILVT